MQASAVFRRGTSAIETAASPRRASAMKAAMEAARFSASLRVIRVQLGQSFIGASSIAENEINFVQQGPLNIREPLFVIRRFLAAQQRVFLVGGVAPECG